MKATLLTTKPGTLLDATRCSYLLKFLRGNDDIFSVLSPVNCDKGTLDIPEKFGPKSIRLGYSFVPRLAEAFGHGCGDVTAVGP